MLELKDISFSVDTDEGRKHILNRVNLKIDTGFTAFTGPNGGGKSTIAKVIAGIYRPTSGKIYLDGEDITDLSISQRAKRGISLAWQQPIRFKGLCVLDLIRLAAGKEIGISEACDYLSKVGLCAREYIHREINSSLSGGELKRIEIAQIIARNTPVSIFDEPEAGIDLWSFQNLIQVFQKLRESSSGSILIISHQERILKIADRVVVISGGAVTDSGSPEDVLPGLLDGNGVCSVLTSQM